MLVIIPDAMEMAMQRDLDKMRDSLPKEEHELFEQERPLIRQQLINFFAENGSYPIVAGIERKASCDICGDSHEDAVPLSCQTGDGE